MAYVTTCKASFVNDAPDFPLSMDVNKWIDGFIDATGVRFDREFLRHWFSNALQFGYDTAKTDSEQKYYDLFQRIGELEARI